MQLLPDGSLLVETSRPLSPGWLLASVGEIVRLVDASHDWSTTPATLSFRAGRCAIASVRSGMPGR